MKTLLPLAACALLLTGCVHKPVTDAPILVAPHPTALSVKLPAALTQRQTHSGNTDAIKQAAKALPSLVYFDFDSDKLNAKAREVLDAQAAFLTANETARVLVAGHTDERGNQAYNLALGERRAAAVRAYLLDKGVPQANVEIISFGEERPAAAGKGSDDRAKNRRVELIY